MREPSDSVASETDAETARNPVYERAYLLWLTSAYGAACFGPPPSAELMDGVLHGRTRRSDERRDPMLEARLGGAALAVAVDLLRQEEALDRAAITTLAAHDEQRHATLVQLRTAIMGLAVLVTASVTIAVLPWLVVAAVVVSR